MEQSLLLTISISLILILFAYKHFSQTNKPHKNHPPPSPPSLPIIGHLYLLRAPLHRRLRRLSETYGPVFALRLGSRRVVVVSSPSAAEECFTTNDVVLANRPKLILSQLLCYNQTTVSTASYGDHWRNLRRIGAIEIFSASRLKAFAAVRRDEVKRLLIKLSSASRVRVSLKTLLLEMSFNVIMRMVADKRYYGEDVSDEAEAREFQEISKELAANGGVANPADFFPGLKWFGGGGEGYERKVKRLADRVDEFLQGLVDEHRRRGEKRNTMIDHLLSLQESQPEYYTDQIIKGFIQILLVAGTETSALTLEWAMANLLNHPEALQKARAELDARVGQTRLVDESETSELTHLQNIISETLRLYPPAPLLAPHFSSADLTLCGHHVPRGTIVVVNAWAIHRDLALWAHPERFMPERFEGDVAAGFRLMPFGRGRRACPGEGMAQRVVGFGLAALIQCFEWERVGAEKVDMAEGRGVTMPKAVPLEALCKARPVMENAVLSEPLEWIK